MGQWTKIKFWWRSGDASGSGYGSGSGSSSDTGKNVPWRRYALSQCF